jgi:hypothetical protein
MYLAALKVTYTGYSSLGALTSVWKGSERTDSRQRGQDFHLNSSRKWSGLHVILKIHMQGLDSCVC